jgi:hypothetical protein
MSNPLFTAMEATGDHVTSACLLMRIAYWWPKAVLERDGHRWIAKTREEWMLETRFTLEQYKGALARLKSRGLVVTEQHIFAGRAVTFLRLTDQGCMGLKAPPGWSVKTPPGRCLETPPNTVSYSSELHTETSNEVSSAGSASASEVDSNTEVSGEMKITGKTAAEIAEKFKNAGASKAPLNKPDSAKILAHIWQTTVAKTYSKFVPEFTLKQLGQMKQLLKLWPPGKGVEIMAVVLSNWGSFAADVKTQTGQSSVATTPNVDFLVKHAVAAANYALDFMQPKGDETVMLSPSKPEPTPVQSIAQKPKPQKASLDELMGIINEEGS